MISAPKTILIADDEPSVRRLLQIGLPAHLPGFQIATVSDGREAIEYLSTHPVEVLVTDISMPVKDGFEVLAHVRNRHPNLAVVVLASMALDAVAARSIGLGAMHVLQKPASAELVARHALEAKAESARGHMSGISVAALLQLMRVERKTCALLIRSGDQKGRLHFLSGELVNAYSFELDAEGEEAARHLLALDAVTVDFERSLHNHVRSIHTPLETLLLEVSTLMDEAERDRGAPAGHAELPPHLPTRAAGLDEALSGLQDALVGLRDRARGTGRLIDATAPSLVQAADRLGGPPDGSSRPSPAGERLDAARAQVAALAMRLIHAANVLGSAEAPGSTPAPGAAEAIGVPGHGGPGHP